MKTSCHIFVTLCALCLSGCRSTHVEPRPKKSHDLNAIVLPQISFHSNSISEIVQFLSQQIRAKYPDSPIEFQLGAGKAREKGQWTQAATGYCVFMPDDQTNTEFGCRVTFNAEDISLYETLRILSSVAMLDWWTEGNTIVVDSDDPVFQAPIRRYDAQARAVLDTVLAHLVSDPEAKRTVDMYLGSFRDEGAAPLKRLRLQADAFPENYTPSLDSVPSLPASGDDLLVGDLFVSVHRYLPRGEHGRKVVLFITAAGIGGGGWVTYIADNTSGTWQLEHRGCYDP